MAIMALIKDMPEGDILIHAGDFMNSGTDRLEITSFNQWIAEQRFKHRVVRWKSRQVVRV